MVRGLSFVIHQRYLMRFEMSRSLDALELPGIEVLGAHSGSSLGIDAAHSLAFNGRHAKLVLGRLEQGQLIPIVRQIRFTFQGATQIGIRDGQKVSRSGLALPHLLRRASELLFLEFSERLRFGDGSPSGVRYQVYYVVLLRLLRSIAALGLLLQPLL